MGSGLGRFLGARKCAFFISLECCGTVKIPLMSPSCTDFTYLSYFHNC
jgi:hypothetical protein